MDQHEHRLDFRLFTCMNGKELTSCPSNWSIKIIQIQNSVQFNCIVIRPLMCVKYIHFLPGLTCWKLFIRILFYQNLHCYYKGRCLHSVKLVRY